MFVLLASPLPMAQTTRVFLSTPKYNLGTVEGVNPIQTGEANALAQFDVPVWLGWVVCPIRRTTHLEAIHDAVKRYQLQVWREQGELPWSRTLAADGQATDALWCSIGHDALARPSPPSQVLHAQQRCPAKVPKPSEAKRNEAVKIPSSGHAGIVSNGCLCLQTANLLCLQAACLP